jgi:Domain of unknown function (DUF4386)
MDLVLQRPRLPCFQGHGVLDDQDSRPGGASKQRLARFIGLLYMINILIGISAIALTKQDKAMADLVNLVGAGEYAVVVVLLGGLFAPAARALSWTAAGMGLAACAASAAMILHLFAFPPGVNPVVVFGPYCVALGLLIVSTDLLPRFLGVLLLVAGISWLTFADPALALRLAPWNTVAGAIPEILLTLWLLVFGVRGGRPEPTLAAA